MKFLNSLTKRIIYGHPDKSYLMWAHDDDRAGRPEVWMDCDKRLHRMDGPAVFCKQYEKWYYHGKLHRIGGPAAIYSTGQKVWWHMDEIHREDGPARIDPEFEQWFRHGKLHREDGPAFIYYDDAYVAVNGTKFEWWLDGEEYFFTSWLKNVNLSDEQKVFLKLKYHYGNGDNETKSS